MMDREQDELLWRYLGGQPATVGFCRKIASDPALARRLAELALIECAIREEAVAAEGSRIMKRRMLVPLISVGSTFVLALLAVAGWWWVSRPAEGTPVATSRDPEVKAMVSAAREGNPVEVKENLFRMGFAREKTNLVFAPGSRMKIETTERGGKRVRLDLGRVDAEVAPQQAPFEVVTPHLEARVVGTKFDVEAEADGSQVLVSEGIVEVNSKSLTKPHEVRRDEGWWQMASGRGVSLAEAHRVASAPVIDGEIDALWDRAATHPLAFLGENNNNAIDSEADHSAWWKAVWDDEALYVLIDVADNADGHGNANPWANDSAEIFVDSDHGRSPKLDSVNDFLLFYDPSRPDIVPGIGSVEAKPGMTHITRRTSGGFRVETKLPWTALGLLPREGKKIGFNVASNDTDETNGKRRSQLTWTPKVPGDFGRPDRMGSLILSGADPP